MVQSAERLDVGRWLGLQNGDGLPAIAWGSPFRHAFEASPLGKASSGLVVVALGSHDRDRANVQVGGLSDAEQKAVWEALGSGQEQPELPGIEDFIEPYDALASKPGVGVVDVVLAAALRDEIHVAHFGPTEQVEVAEKLGPYTREVMARMGIEAPDMRVVTASSAGATLVHPNGSTGHI
jgi:hypothetical protein